MRASTDGIEYLKKPAGEILSGTGGGKDEDTADWTIQGNEGGLRFSWIHVLQHNDQRRQISTGNPQQQEEIEGKETSGEGVAQDEIDKTSSRNDETTGIDHPRSLQLLWSEWKLPCDTKLLEVPEIFHISNVEPP